jgi:arylamine N-acetyltransferase
MAKPRSTFTTRAKESLKEQSQNFARSEDRAARRGDTASAERFAARRERVDRALNGVYAREQRPKKRKRKGSGSSAGS